MNNALIAWDIYEIRTNGAPVQGISLRGTLRKFALSIEMNMICENSQGGENCVRFAVLAESNILPLKDFIAKLVPGSTVKLEMKEVLNPVLSKLSVNNTEKYTI